MRVLNYLIFYQLTTKCSMKCHSQHGVTSRRNPSVHSLQPHRSQRRGFLQLRLQAMERVYRLRQEHQIPKKLLREHLRRRPLRRHRPQDDLFIPPPRGARPLQPLHQQRPRVLALPCLSISQAVGAENGESRYRRGSRGGSLEA